MTGMFVRVGSESIEIENLTDEQFEKLTQDQPEKGWRWAKALARWIRDNIRETSP